MQEGRRGGANVLYAIAWNIGEVACDGVDVERNTVFCEFSTKVHAGELESGAIEEHVLGRFIAQELHVLGHPRLGLAHPFARWAPGGLDQLEVVLS